MPPAEESQVPPHLLAAIDDRLASMAHHLQSSLDSKLSTLLEQLSLVPTQPPPPPPPHPPPRFTSGFPVGPSSSRTPTGINSSSPSVKSLKLHLAAFDGSELDWVFQAEQFFQYHNTIPAQRMGIIPFYMKGEALSWYEWLYTNEQLSTWDEFIRQLNLRFGPSCYENPQQELFKLMQTSTVLEYQTRFERLSNQVVGLPPDLILNCFISGLQQEIKKELQVLRPYSVHQTIGLAKLIESKLKDPKPSPYKAYKPDFPTVSSRPTQAVALPSSQPQPCSSPSALPLKRLTSAQMQERRTLGLCYNCDERYTQGHRCQSKRFLLLLMDDTPEQGDPSTVEVSVDEPVSPQTPSKEEEMVHFQLFSPALQGSP